jgi:hypothetical protein
MSQKFSLRKRLSSLPLLWRHCHLKMCWRPSAATPPATGEQSAKKTGRKTNSRSARVFRLFSVYTSTSGTRFWIITEADRSVTTVLLPDDY